MSEIVNGKYTDKKATKNCHEYCHYGKMCRYLKGSNGVDPDDCAMYYKLDDLMNEARDMEREQRKESDDYDEWE